MSTKTIKAATASATSSIAKKGKGRNEKHSEKEILESGEARKPELPKVGKKSVKSEPSTNPEKCVMHGSVKPLSPAETGKQAESMIGHASNLTGGMRLLIESFDHHKCLGRGIAASLKAAKKAFPECEEIKEAFQTWTKADFKAKQSFTNAWGNAMRSLGKKKRGNGPNKAAMVGGVLEKMKKEDFESKKDFFKFKNNVLAYLTSIEESFE